MQCILSQNRWKTSLVWPESPKSFTSNTLFMEDESFEGLLGLVLMVFEHANTRQMAHELLLNFGKKLFAKIAIFGEGLEQNYPMNQLQTISAHDPAILCLLLKGNRKRHLSLTWSKNLYHFILGGSEALHLDSPVRRQTIHHLKQITISVVFPWKNKGNGIFSTWEFNHLCQFPTHEKITDLVTEFSAPPRRKKHCSREITGAQTQTCFHSPWSYSCTKSKDIWQGDRHGPKEQICSKGLVWFYDEKSVWKILIFSQSRANLDLAKVNTDSTWDTW